ncbi:MAG TPA: hypothetical protein VI776_14190 [Anaerolineales bacterium]|nr:hypothetical protein [Anaerolineales bacterium]
MRYEVRQISLRSLVVSGAIVGLVFSCLPALCLGVVALRLIARAADLLISMRSFMVQIPDLEAFGLSVDLPDIPVDLVSRLGLEGLEGTVLALAASGGLFLALLLLGGLLLGALVVALFALLWGAVFNLIAPRLGGLEVELQPGLDNEQGPDG